MVSASIVKLMWKTSLRGIIFSVIFGIARFARAVEYKNPLNNVTTLPQLLNAVANAVIQVGGTLAAVAIIWVGFKFVLAAAQGDQAGLTQARKMLWYVIIGTLIIVGAGVIARVAVDVVQQIRA